MKKQKLFLGLLLFVLLVPFTLVNASEAKCYLEYPSEDALLGDYMYLQGWAMSNDKESQIKIFIDESEVDADINRYERMDVINAISGYGGSITNPLPGFKGTLDLSDYAEGTHTVKMVVENSLGVVQSSYTKKILINKDLAKMYIDYPTSSTLNGDTIFVEGWIMSTITEGRFLVYLDDEEVQFDITRRERPDVVSAISGYGDGKVNQYPGFSIKINAKDISEGSHKVDIFYVRNDEKVLTSQSVIVNKKDVAKMYIDYPTTNNLFDDELVIEGWVMSTITDENFSLYLDGEELQFDITRRERPDVVSAISGYGDGKVNQLPGFSITASLEGISDGNHTVEVIYSSKEGNVLEKKVVDILLKRNIGRMYLDNPKGGDVSSTVAVEGWIMTPNQNYQLVLYVDDNPVEADFSRRSRVDVVQAVSGYGDGKVNKNPGFSTKVDLSNYKDGKHYIMVKAISSDGVVIVDEGVEVNLNKYSAKMYIDRVEYDYDKYGTEMLVRGWNVTDCSNYAVKLYIDDNYIKDITNRTVRADVLNAYGYLYGTTNQNALPGYEDFIDVSNMVDGSHKITIKIINDKTNEVLEEESKNINLVKYSSDITIENPLNNQEFLSDNIDVSGWIMTDAANVSLKFYIDETEVVPSELVRVERNDVTLVFNNKYDTVNQNKTPGFNASIDVSSFIDGNHIIRVDVINGDTNEVLMSSSRTFNMIKYNSDMYIDYPKTSVSGTTTEISGWILTESPTSELEFYIDGEMVDINNYYRRERPDVLEAYKDKYKSDEINKEPGYHSSVDLTNYKDGEHLVTVKVINTITKEVLISKDRVFSLKKYDGMISFEYPKKSNFSNSSQLYIQGWELSETANSVVKVYFDDLELSVNREERVDVLNAYPDYYGGVTVNEMPGFNTIYDLSQIASGEHTLKVELYSSYGDLIDASTKKIMVFDNLYFGIDVSSHQGTINWGEVKKNGIDFAILRLGFGDNFTSQDDTKFIDNVNGCVENNIPYGVYLYSYALNKNGVSELNQNSESIDSEIAHTLRVLNSLTSSQKANLKLPVFIDMEDNSTVSLGKEKLTDMADYYCTNISNSGYKCGVYANKNWLNNYLDGTYLGSKYDIWLAHYTNDYNNFSDYNGIYQVWQYTSTGSLTGIYSSGLDMNISLKKYW